MLEIIKLYANPFIIDSTDDRNWERLKNPSRRKTLEPWPCSRTLWSISKTFDADGVYRGSALVRGYQIIPESMKDLRTNGDNLTAS